MSQVTLKGNPFNTYGQLPKVGSLAPDFKLTKLDLSEANLATYAGKRKVLNIFPSVDTPTCATSVRKFNEQASALKNTVVLCISADLPFAQKRFCGAENISNVESLSTFRSHFGKDYQLEMTDSPLRGLCSRAVVVLDENNKVIHTEQVSEIANEPNYDAVIAVLK
ncbi:MAG: thiol peroxidase [Bdellovibrionales bacterium]|nr:thiol peroxidase [Bdellovibrionales bacterium]